MQENIKASVRAKETQQAVGDRQPSRSSLKGAQAAATALDHVRSGVLLHPGQAWLPHWAVFHSSTYLPHHMACMQDPSSPTREQTCSLVVEAQSPNHWSTREVQLCSSNIFFFFFFCIRVLPINNVVSFRWILKGLSHTHTSIHPSPNSSSIQAATNFEQSSLCYTVGPLTNLKLVIHFFLGGVNIFFSPDYFY